MSTGIMTGTAGLGRPDVRERTPTRGRGTSAGAGTQTRRRHLVPPRTGSRQQVTVRGRRVTAVRDRHGSNVLRLVIALVLLVGAGVAATMYLSARTTDQAFVLSEANARSETLGNELESLNRDYKELSSSEHLASEAARLGMVVPGQAGVLDVQGGDIREVRPADRAGDGQIVDLDGTGAAVPRTDRPTSDPAAVAAVPATSPAGEQSARDAAQQAPAAAQPAPADAAAQPAPADAAAQPAPADAAAQPASGASPQNPASATGQLPYPSRDLTPAG